MTSGDPIRSHIEALHRSGWTYRQIAAESGVEVARLYKIRTSQCRVLVRTADNILALEPLASADIDDVIVQRLVNGFPVADWRAVGANRAERLEAFARMDYRDRRDALKARGYGDQQIELPSAERVREYLGLRSDDIRRELRQGEQVAS